MSYNYAISLPPFITEIHNCFVKAGYPLLLEYFPGKSEDHYGWKVNEQTELVLGMFVDVYLSTKGIILVKIKDRSVTIEFPRYFLCLPLKWLLAYLNEFLSLLRTDEHVTLTINSNVIRDIIVKYYPELKTSAFYTERLKISYEDGKVYLEENGRTYGEIKDKNQGYLSFRDVDITWEKQKEKGSWTDFQEYLNQNQTPTPPLLHPSPSSYSSSSY